MDERQVWIDDIHSTVQHALSELGPGIASLKTDIEDISDLIHGTEGLRSSDFRGYLIESYALIEEINEKHLELRAILHKIDETLYANE